MFFHLLLARENLAAGVLADYQLIWVLLLYVLLFLVCMAELIVAYITIDSSFFRGCMLDFYVSCHCLQFGKFTVVVKFQFT